MYAEYIISKAFQDGLQKESLPSGSDVAIHGDGMNKFIERLWRNIKDGDGNFIIPYEFNSAATFSDNEKTVIKSALQKLSDDVGGYVKFVKKTSDHGEFITFTDNNGCRSFISKVPRARTTGQDLSLGPGCVRSGIIQHEMMHALGFFHEQERPDWEDYITINWDNVKEGHEKEFSESVAVDPKGTPYDYDSIMHYGTHFLSANGKPTIDAHGHDIGQRVKLSDLDIIQVRLSYQCEDKLKSYADYMASPCSSDCTCSLGMPGCAGSDANCRGNLICKKDVCSDPREISRGLTIPTSISKGKSCCQSLVESSGFVYNKHNSKAVCVSAKVTGSCSSLVSYNEARSICEGKNARLCARRELKDGEADGIGCQLDSLRVWTSTPCKGGKGFYIAEGYNGGRRKCKNPTRKESKAMVLCCSDKC